MNNSVKALLLAAAGTGLMSGTAPARSAPIQNGRAFSASTLANLGQMPSTFAQDAQDAKHSCKGQNNCKGQGGCGSGDNGCKGKNSCKGKGGCMSDM